MSQLQGRSLTVTEVGTWHDGEATYPQFEARLDDGSTCIVRVVDGDFVVLSEQLPRHLD